MWGAWLARRVPQHSGLGLPGPSDGAVASPSSSKHYPLYSLNVASVWLKLGRLYLGLEHRAAGEKALRKVRLAVRGGRPGSSAADPEHV